MAVADEDDLQASTELYKLTVGNLQQLLGWRKVGAPKGGRRPMSPERCRQLAAALQAPKAHHQRECAMASARQRGIVPLVGKLPHQQAAELIPNPNPMARALDLALGPRYKPNPKQAAKLIANLQEAMCRRQEEAELKFATARTSVPISPLPPLPSNGPRPAAAARWARRLSLIHI